jgi:hypothetical protein
MTSSWKGLKWGGRAFRWSLLTACIRFCCTLFEALLLLLLLTSHVLLAT